MKKLLVLFLIVIIFETWYIAGTFKKPTKPQPVPKPLLVYSFENLKKTNFPTTNIQMGIKVSEDKDTFSQTFYYQTPKKPDSQDLIKVSGLMNAPVKPGNYPVIILLRGFVPSEMYKPGIGSEPVAKMLAQKGFITLAPDFLGYGESDKGASDSFENRFQTYTTVLSLFSSLSTLNDGLSASYSGRLTADISNVGIWAHSNGGHIALSVLAISGKTYPTVLWAPVSTSFPYSILFYTDESDDQGKAMRKVLSQFEDVYNIDVFSPVKYYNWIKAPLDIEQGTADQEVPYWWSDNLVETLKKNKLDVEYNKHIGADHNMLPTITWNSAVSDTISFFKSQFK